MALRFTFVASLGFVLAGCPLGRSGLPLSPREQATVLLQRGDGASAVPILEQLHRETPTDLAIARALCEAHSKAGTGPSLLQRLAPRLDAVSCYMRGLLKFASTADASAPAIAEFKRAVELAPDEPEFHHRLGVALVESEQFEAALAELTIATRAAPEKFGWALPLAKARFRTGDTKGAVDAIRLVITNSPSPAEAQLAKDLMAQVADPYAAFPKSAKGALDQAIQWLEVADQPQQALLELEQLAKDYPDIAAVHALMGLSYARLDDAGRAVDELKRAIELNPDDGKAYLYLGEFYLGRQRGKAAQELFEKAAEKNPTLSNAWVRLGEMALERQDRVTALRDYEIASRLSPSDTRNRARLAEILQAEGNFPAATKELKSVLQNEPDNLEFLLRLGLLYAEQALKTKAAEDKQTLRRDAESALKHVLELQPENALASRALEQIQRQ